MRNSHPHKKPARAVQRSTGWSYTRSLRYVEENWKHVQAIARISERKRRLAEMAMREQQLLGDKDGSP
jgi:hypothetical protein